MKRSKTILLPVVASFALLAGSVVWVPQLLWGDRVDYSQVASIRRSHEYQDTALLEKAWALPVARLYRSDIVYQRNASFCGPSSLVNVLRSVSQASDQVSILQDTDIATVLGFIPGGVTLDELAGLAHRKLAGNIVVLRNLDEKGFREHLRRLNDPSRRYVINFARGPLFGSGGGHHSPLAGYLVDEDLVLVLDVNQKFGPWLVKAARLYEAMNTVDPVANKKRGLLLIEPEARAAGFGRN